MPTQVAVARGDVGPCDLEEIAKDWGSTEWLNYLPWIRADYSFPEENNGLSTIEGMVHPDSREAERLRITIDFKHDGPDPLIQIAWHNGPSRDITNAKPIDNGWYMMELTGIRDGDNSFGTCLDMFTYTTRDVEVRSFHIADIGPVGDLNLDGVVNELDLQIAINNYGLTGDLEVEDGDANGDGNVNVTDSGIVIEDMPE